MELFNDQKYDKLSKYHSEMMNEVQSQLALRQVMGKQTFAQKQKRFFIVARLAVCLLVENGPLNGFLPSGLACIAGEIMLVKGDFMGLDHLPHSFTHFALLTCYEGIHCLCKQDI